MAQAIEQIIARWDSGEGKPYKGRLIDMSAYQGDGTEPPENIGCMCAGGQVLHLLGGWTPRMLMDSTQASADTAVANLLGISRAHAILLRNVNDAVDGAPSIVLTHPERVLGDQAPTVLAFWRHLDAMTREQWVAARATAWAAARATNEIQGAAVMRERGQPFYFLPLFGFAQPEDVLTKDKSA